jgi:hypothetical protein
VPRLEFVSKIDFVAHTPDSQKDCLMAQDETNPDALWFNIDAPLGHGFQVGDQVKVTVEKV